MSSLLYLFSFFPFPLDLFQAQGFGALQMLRGKAIAYTEIRECLSKAFGEAAAQGYSSLVCGRAVDVFAAWVLCWDG